MRVESRARARALQALYAWDVRGGGDPSLRSGQSLERVATQVWDDLAIPPTERRIASLLVREIIQDGEVIDEELADVTTNWRLERLGVVERCVLRLAAAELRRGETPPRVVIQEAMHLAERFAGGQSARFVNGVVDALARRMGQL